MRRLFAALLVLLCAAPSAVARSLDWRAVEVDAHLEDDGRLTVSERHVIVFDGDWNGGQRTFQLRPGERVEVVGVTQVSEVGERVPLEKGDLSGVRQYAQNGNELHWRMRMPDDPPFVQDEQTFVIDYVLFGILRPSPDDAKTFDVNHDFFFTVPNGEIGRFAARFDASDAWVNAEDAKFTAQLEHAAGPVTLRRSLVYAREGAPTAGLPVAAAVSTPVVTETTATETQVEQAPAAEEFFAPEPLRQQLALVMLGVGVLWAVLLLREQRMRGRFAKHDPDEAHLSDYASNFKAEAAGYLLDERITSAKVAAVLARLVGEHKLETSLIPVGHTAGLSLKLLVPAESIGGYEGELIRSIFPAGITEIHAGQMRDAHRWRGFAPHAIVEGGVRAELANREGMLVREGRVSYWTKLAVVLMFLLWLASRGASGFDDDLALSITFGMSLLMALFGAFLAERVSRQLGAPARRAVGAWLLSLLVMLTAAAMLVVHLEIRTLALFAMAANAIALFGLLADLVRTPYTSPRIEAMLRIGAAQRWLYDELRTSRPDVKDEWMPYVLGLEQHEVANWWFWNHFTSRGSVSAMIEDVVGHWNGGGKELATSVGSGTWIDAAMLFVTGFPPARPPLNLPMPSDEAMLTALQVANAAAAVAVAASELSADSHVHHSYVHHIHSDASSSSFDSSSSSDSSSSDSSSSDSGSSDSGGYDSSGGGSGGGW